MIESSHFPSVLLPDGLSHLVPFLFCFAFFNFPFRPPGYFVFFCQIIGTLVLTHPILFDLFEEPCCCSIFLPVPFFHLLWLYLCVFLDYGSVFVFVLVIVFSLSILFFISMFEKNLVAANLFRSRLFLSRSSSRACQQVDCYLFSELNFRIYVVIFHFSKD